ncbi:hypothetical protein OG579_03430 [Williamsia herbipolensis]|uniref:Uncharacterized protein n=1 Tax=Williamsia herbipolensis TaxID=1603258 RepID=A0AAU4K4H8_9NOCA|nr:hypothetical protein [Williamsia herbipolensis]
MPPDWFEAVTTYSAMPIALAGFYYTIRQLYKTKASAVAAKEAADEANDRSRALLTASMIPHLVTIEQALEVAIDEQSRPLLRHLINTWTWHAGACRELLVGDSDEIISTQKAVQTSISAARILKTKLVTFDSTTDWHKETSRLRGSIGVITGYLGSLSVQQSTPQEPAA